MDSNLQELTLDGFQYEKSIQQLHFFMKNKLYWIMNASGEWILKDVNVLGAGDFFAASFLYAIHKGWPLDGAIQAAHCTTSDLIRKYNEEV